MDRERFLSLWDRCAAKPSRDIAESVFTALEAHYAEPQRHYHSAQHIERCLATMDSASSQLGPNDAVEMGLWFHDAIYEIGAKDNEEQSAEWFRDVCGDSLDPEFTETVYRLIMATIHNSLPDPFDERYIVDVDLSGFGLPWDEFLQDSRAVRAELTHLDDDAFNRSHSVFMEKLLNRPTIFGTDYFIDNFEAQARQNIESVMARLKDNLPWS